MDALQSHICLQPMYTGESRYEFLKIHKITIIINSEAREIMYLVASVCPFFCLSVSALTAEPLGALLCRVRQRAKKSHYQSKVFVCVSNSRADAVDRLLISNGGKHKWTH